jgi:hypothetical protein
MLKKTTMCVSLVACLVFAGTATAAPVEYTLTADTPVGFGGTLTWDSTVGTSFADGGISAFAFVNPLGTTGIFDETDTVSELVIGLSGSVPVSLMIDIDDTDGSNDFLFTNVALDFNTGLGHLSNPDFDVTGAALTAVPEPATMSLLALGGLAMLRRRRRA